MINLIVIDFTIIIIDQYLKKSQHNLITCFAFINS